MSEQQRDIQLLPETRKEIRVKTRGGNKELIIAVGFFALVMAGYFAIFTYKESRLGALALLDLEFQNVEKARDKELEKNLLSLEQQLQVVNPILAGHIFWTKGLGTFESLINPQVRVKSLNLTTDKISLQAVAASYIVVARQVAALFSEESFTLVNLGKVSLLQTDELEFSIELTFDKDKLLK